MQQLQKLTNKHYLCCPHMQSRNKINSVLATIYFISAPHVRTALRRNRLKRCMPPAYRKPNFYANLLFILLFYCILLVNKVDHSAMLYVRLFVNQGIHAVLNDRWLPVNSSSRPKTSNSYQVIELVDTVYSFLQFLSSFLRISVSLSLSCPKSTQVLQTYILYLKLIQKQ